MIKLYPPKKLCEIELFNLAARSPEDFVAFCEDSYSERINHVAATIVAGDFKVVMLTGPSSVGKTTTSGRIAKRLCEIGMPARIISLDNFFRPHSEYPILPDGTRDFESIETIDIPEFVRCLDELMQKGEVMLPVYDFVNSRRSDEREHFVINDGVVIVEGIHALNPTITPHFKSKMFKIYLSMREEYAYKGRRLIPSIDMRLARRMVRDNFFRGYSPERTLALWSKVCDGEVKYIKAYKGEANYMFDTAHGYEPCVMLPFLEGINVGEIEDINHAKLFEALRERYRLFTPLDKNLVPENSMLKEFIKI